MPNKLNYCDKHKCNKELVLNCRWECKKCISESLKNGSNQHEEVSLKNLLSMKIKNAHVPLDLKNKDLNNFLLTDEEDEKRVDRAKRYMKQIVEEKTHLNLMITGPTGVGKSHLAVGILKYCYELNYFRNSICYSTSFGLASKVIATWKNPDLNEEDVLKEYTEIDILVIDDLGYDDMGKKAEIINKIIYRRFENQKSTIITSNLKADQVLAYMDTLCQIAEDYNNLSFNKRESIKFELSLYGTQLEDLKDVNDTKRVKDLNNDKAYEEQQLHLEAQKEQIAARRRYIDSGGLEEEVNTEMERRMKEVESDEHDAD